MARLFFLIFLSLNSFIFCANDDFINQFEKIALSEQKAWNVPGMAIAIVKGDEILHLKGYGTRGLDNTQTVDENTLFQIGSLSKAFTAALMAIAEDRKWLKWDDPVIQHLPAFHLQDNYAGAEFKIEDLLAQRSGLPAYAGDLQAILGYSSNDIIKNLRLLKPATSFRESFAYQNNMFLVGGKILERKSNQSFEKLLKKDLFIPLGMSRSSATLKDYLSDENRAEWLMRLKDGSLYHLPDDFPYRNWTYVLSPAGGINSTIRDMAHWMLLQVNNGKYKDMQLISERNMQRMRRAMIFANEKDGLEMYYALGWVRMENSPYPIIWHDGATLGVFNVAAFIPEEKLGIVILTNVRDSKLALGLMLQFFDLFYGSPVKNWSQEFLNETNKQKISEVNIKEPFPPMPLERYEGIFYNPIYGNAEIKKEGDFLKLTVGKIGPPFTLEPLDRDSFQILFKNIDEEPSSAFFLSDGQGNIRTLQIDAFTKEGSGDFTKK